MTTERDTKYDDRPGIIFLDGPITPVVPISSDDSSDSTGTRSDTEDASSATSTYNFVLHHRETSFDYSIDTTSRVWLPAEATTAGGGTVTKSNGSADPEFITDGTEDPPPMVSLADFRTLVSDIDAMLKQGAGSEAWEICIYSKFSYPNYMSHWGRTELRKRSRTFDSGQPSVKLYASGLVGHPGYNVYWTSGPDRDLFEGVVLDGDSDSQNGYHYKYASTRPLPAGSYSVNTHMQHYSYVPCDFKPDDNPSIYDVTVVPPSGTLHEAFFDPVTVGTAVRADATNGKLEPREFEVDGTSTEINSLEWSNNQVVLTLVPHVSLGANILHFIELDGTTSLSLPADEATVDSAAGTYSWPVTTEPWEDGDQLMLRLRRPPGVTVKLSPRVDPLDIKTDITMEWVDSQDCNDEYFVAIYNDHRISLITRGLGRHPAPDTDTITADTGELWDLFPSGPYYNYWAGVTCTTGWRLVGKASLASGLSNAPATGSPTISGTAQAGQTLTASTTGISDSDGLTNVSYTYQWLADDTAISGATSSTYTLTDDEVGDAIKVKVSFTDDRDNAESLTSSATSAVTARPNNAATGSPTISGTARLPH